MFDESTVERIRLIKQLQDMGLHLQEIDAMLRAVGEHSSTCEHEAAKVRAALERTEEKLAALTAVRDKLALALERCTRGECTLVERVARVVSNAGGRRAARGNLTSTARARGGKGHD